MALLMLPLPAQADRIDRSLRPLPNPALFAPAPVVTEAVASSPRPRARPEGLAAAKPEKTARKKAPAAGSVCGVASITGQSIAPIKGKLSGCGLQDGVRVTAVSGVRLSDPASIDCPTARALDDWVAQVLQPAYGGKVIQLQVAAHYVCRSRNNIRGAPVSEHGRGRAIDISGFTLAGGKTVSVARDWGRKLARVHKGACGIFTTTLGPGSDGFHEDHLHFDTARRGSTYCR